MLPRPLHSEMPTEMPLSSDTEREDGDADQSMDGSSSCKLISRIDKTEMLNGFIQQSLLKLYLHWSWLEDGRACYWDHDLSCFYKKSALCSHSYFRISSVLLNIASHIPQ